MAQKEKEIRDKYPLPAYNFRVSLLVLPLPVVASAVMASPPGAHPVGFSEVSGLSQRFEPVVYRDGFSFFTGPSIMQGMKKEVNLTLRRGVLRNGDQLFLWLEETRLPTAGKRDLLIDLCDENGDPSVRWIVRNAMPIQLSAPEFNANSNDVAIESLELIAESVSMGFILTNL